MRERVVVKGGRVVDGSGLAAFGADVEIVDGTITAVGRIDAGSARVIDADGLVVAPGFVDLHTHFDAQLHFEPMASPTSWHGVTTVVVGNCGFSLAPSKPNDVAWLLKMLSRVEGMSEEALAEGVTFGGGGMQEFFEGLEGGIGVNVAGYVGHAALRRYAMGDDASERAATSEEVAVMCELLRRGLDEGAIGLSTSQLELHRDHYGKPVPCNLATRNELVALAGVFSDRSRGVIEIFPRSFGSEHGYDDEDERLLLEMAAVSGKAIHGNVIGYFASSPTGWQRNLAVAERAAEKGLRIYPMLILNPKGVHFALDSTFIFDEYPTWRDVLTKPMIDRMALLRDRAVRNRMTEEIADPALGSLHLQWEEVYVVAASGPNRALEGRSIAAVAAEKGVQPLDALLDLSSSEELGTVFAIRRDTAEKERAVIDKLIDHPLVMAGSSDGGAHLQTFCGADYTTRLLTEWVPERLTLEQAVSKLTFIPASALGLWDRGLLRPGMAGDVVTFDPDQLRVDPVRMLNDFPAGASRLVFPSEGYKSMLVNGTPIRDNGEVIEALAGRVLRV